MPFELYYSHPEKGPQIIPLDQVTMKLGSLLSNQVVIEGEGVEQIHALLEDEDGKWILTDVSDGGLKVNGKKVTLEAILAAGDQISLGKVNLTFRLPLAGPPPVPGSTPKVASAKKDKVSEPDAIIAEADRERRARNPLFAPRTAESVGDVLEVVAFWQNQVLDIEHFREGSKAHSKFTIGDPTKGHFLAAGDEVIREYVVAEPTPDGYTLNLLKGMTARVRGAKSVKDLGAGTYNLTRKDIAHVRYGPVHYFLNFARPQILQLPREGLKDPFLFGLMAVVMGIYILVTLALFLGAPYDPKKDDSDIWSLVQAPEKVVEIPRPVTKPVTIVEEVKTPPPPPEVPPPPPPKPVEAVTPKEPEKPKEIAKPKPEPRAVESLSKAKTQQPKPVPKEAPKAKVVPVGNGQAGAPRAGKSDTNVKGAEADNKKPSAPNLDKLGLGVGKIASTSGPGAIHTNFKNSAGGAGGGSGSAPKTIGLGGLSEAKSLGISGSASAVSQFEGAKLVKENEVGQSFKGSREAVAVNVRATDPVVSGGLGQDEIIEVINKNINQIRHCYQRLLQKDPSAVGRVKVRFVIGLNGRVKSADVEGSTFSDSEIGTCLTGVIKRWQFPLPRGSEDVKVNYPFLFNPVN